jgi:glycosyltransferase involved in cell wall biosynthesis
MTAAPRYALVHEWLTPKATGGSELVVKEILDCINADLFALIDFESTNPNSYLYQRSIGTTFLQRLPLARNGVQKYLPLLPLAIEQLDLRDYDIILSSAHAVAKGVLTTADQMHICYCHAPMRYAWDMTFDYLQGSAGRGLKGALTRYLLHRLRLWDALAANRVDHFIANSHNTARRIWRAYRRPATVIYPPVDVDRFPYVAQKQDYYVTVSRLVGYKKIPLIVAAFNELGLPLVVIGSGNELEQVQRMARSNVQVLGWQPDDVVEQYLSQARAFVYAAYEDFGIAPVEAQACGTPVIAYGVGGTRETVRDLRQSDRPTGILFPQQTVAAIVEVVRIFEQNSHQIVPEQVRAYAETFRTEAFQRQYQQFVDRAYADFVQAGGSNYPTHSDQPK